MKSRYDELILGDWLLESGTLLRDGRLAYKTYGELNKEKSNAILLCSHIAGTHENYEPLIQIGHCFDPSRYFVIATNMFANGLSSSPTNTPAPQNGPYFPEITIRDNVRAQHILVTERLNINRIALVAGYSMGAQQTFQWAVSNPDMVDHIAPWCGHARTTGHTWAFLEGMASVALLGPDWKGGLYREPPVDTLSTMARVFSGWGFSQAWYREECFKQLGHSTVQEFIANSLEKRFLQRDLNNYLSQLRTWQKHDVGSTPGFMGNFKNALASIQARAVIMPCRTDLYFPPEDSALEASYIQEVTMVPIESIWGHYAGMGVNSEDMAFIDKTIQEFLP